MRLIFSLLTISSLLFGCQSSSESSKAEIPVEPLIAFQSWESKSDQGWSPSQKVEYKYDGNDLLIQEVSSRIQGDSASLFFRKLHSYDPQGNMITSIRERWINGSWIFAIRSAFIHNNGEIVQRIDSVAGSNAPITFITYRYNDEGLLESELGLRSVEGNMINHSRVLYQYNERGLPIEKQYPRWSENSWMNSRKMDLFYNEVGHHIQTIRYNWVEGEWVESINYLLDVDDSGTRLSELWSRSGENGPEEFTRVSYTYR